MKIASAILSLLFLCNGFLHAQQTAAEIEEVNGSDLEDLSETEEAEPEDDYVMLQLAAYAKHRLNINGPLPQLQEFPLLTPLQIDNLIQYRHSLGDLISVYELQAVPGFDISTIRQMLPYIAISDTTTTAALRQRFTGGSTTLVVRPTIIPERPEGFRTGGSPSSAFLGTRPSLFVRYTYQQGRLLEYGVTGDKDVGEKFLSTRFPFVMDFTSFHFFARDAGRIKALAIGDFTVNMGQGLIHWQSQAFRKTSGVLNIKRQSDILRPYKSAGEFNFHRGLAATLQLHSWQATAFVSARNLSANITSDPSGHRVVTSLILSGLNRTATELADKNQLRLLTCGGTLKKVMSAGHVSMNVVAFRYSLPLQKRSEPYNLYSVRGNNWMNGSVDYSFTLRNFHGFGEVGADWNRKLAAVAGLIASLGAATDIAVLYRNISVAYQSLYGNAFTENTSPSNEKGFYSGISFRPAQAFRIDLYADIFSFRWLKYRVDAPSRGLQYLVQLSWKPSKTVEAYSRFRLRMKPLNGEPEEGMDFPDDRVIKNWRSQVSFQFSRTLLLRSRTETCTFVSSPGQPAETGYLFFCDILYRPPGKPLSAGIRFQRFETGGYDARIYAYENDLFLVSSTPSFYGRGSRCYFNLRGKVRIKSLKASLLNISVKIGTTLYDDRDAIGSGGLTIHGNHRTDLRLQVYFSPGA